MNDLVSIIIPTYNAEQYLRRCILSVLNQTYSNIQVIIVNDGSQDNTSTICRELQYFDDRIHYIEKDNEGAGSAKNAGLLLAKGEYITFVDSDDFISCDYIEYLLDKSKKYNADIAQVSYIRGSDERFPELHDEELVIEYNNINIFFSRNYKSVAWGKIYRKYLFQENKFTVNRRIDDETIVYKLYYNANKIVYSNLKKYYYYLSKNSIMRSNSSSIDYGFIKTFEERIKYFKNRKQDELVEVTISRMCLSILMKMSSNNKISDEDFGNLKNIFDNYSQLIKNSKNIPIKEKIIIRIGRISPKTIVFLLKLRNR